MVVNQVVPGQEEGNYELLRRHGIGSLATSPEKVLEVLRSAFAGEGNVWSGWRRALAPLSRPQAAEDILDRIIATANPGTARPEAEILR